VKIAQYLHRNKASNVVLMTWRHAAGGGGGGFGGVWSFLGLLACNMVADTFERSLSYHSTVPIIRPKRDRRTVG
jgi:hypothetical protein